jgi:hypothetical protein
VPFRRILYSSQAKIRVRVRVRVRVKIVKMAN